MAEFSDIGKCFILCGKNRIVLTFYVFHCTVFYWNGNNQINKTFSYSEQWRYKGSKKLRQPHIIKEGANLSELLEQ